MNLMSIAAALVMVSPVQHDGGEGTTKTMIAHYSLAIPDGYAIRRVSPPMVDFLVYEVFKKGAERVRLGMYFGNFPDFPDEHWGKAPLSQRAEGRTIAYFPFDPEARRIEGLLQFDIQMTLGDLPSPYSQIHYFSGRVTRKEAAVFERVVSSVAVLKPRL